MKVFDPFFLALFAVLQAGCLVVAPFQVRPPLSGVVLSNARPLANASVTVDTWSFSPIGNRKIEKEHSVTTQTDLQGRWSISRETDWHFGVLAADGLPTWAQDLTFEYQGTTVSLDAARHVQGWYQGKIVQQGELQVRLDQRKSEGPRLLPAIGVMAGRGQSLCVYGGGLLILSHTPVRLALRLDGEIGIKGLAGFGGLALGAPTGELPFLNLDLGARIFRAWTGNPGSAYKLGPALAVSLVNVRILVAVLRETVTDPQASHGWELHLGAGIGYM